MVQVATDGEHFLLLFLIVIIISQFVGFEPKIKIKSKIGIMRRKSLSLQPHDQNHQIDNEEQHDGGLENDHPAIVLVVLEELIEIVERLELAVDRSMPVAEMKARSNTFVDARKMPVPEELGGVGQFVV